MVVKSAYLDASRTSKVTSLSKPSKQHPPLPSVVSTRSHVITLAPCSYNQNTRRCSVTPSSRKPWANQSRGKRTQYCWPRVSLHPLLNHRSTRATTIFGLMITFANRYREHIENAILEFFTRVEIPPTRSHTSSADYSHPTN